MSAKPTRGKADVEFYNQQVIRLTATEPTSQFRHHWKWDNQMADAS